VRTGMKKRVGQWSALVCGREGKAGGGGGE
jgi:hypothetical protein